MSADDDYFITVDAKPAIKDAKNATAAAGDVCDVMSLDDTRPDLLLDHYKHVRKTRLTHDGDRLVDKINTMFVEWCELFFCGFNVVVTGAQSKFSLLETFRLNYLESGRMPNFIKPQAKNGDSFVEFKTVVCHGMEPIDLDTFHHGLMGIKEKRKITERDYKNFIAETRRINRHYCFILHSFELFYTECEDIFELIVKLYEMAPERIHIVMSSDYFNAGKKLNIIKYKIRLLFYVSPYGESFFEEKLYIGQRSAIEASGANGDSTGRLPINRLLDGLTDLQAIKDTYQALGNARHLMVFLIEDFVKRSEHSSSSSSSSDKYLEFQDVLRLMQAKFVIRRGSILRQQLAELMDHSIIDYDESKQRIQCIVQLSTCKKFLDYINEQKQNDN